MMQEDIPNIYGTGANPDKFVGNSIKMDDLPRPAFFVTKFDPTTLSPLALERNIYCSVCGKPGRFKANGKGKMAGKHRACRKPKAGFWGRVKAKLGEIWANFNVFDGMRSK